MNTNVFKHFYLFNIDNNFYIFDYYNFILFEINKNTYFIILELDKNGEKSLLNKFKQDEINKVLNFLEICKKKGIFYSKSENKNQFIENKVHKAFFSFPTIHDCNLRCKYCFASHGKNFTSKQKKMSKEMVEKIFNYVYFDVFKDYDTYKLDLVSGGEPLLNFELIKHAIEYSKKLNEFTGKKLQIFLCTNGTINKPEFWEYLNNNNVSLGISIDGTEKNHNNTRVFDNDEGSYRIVVSTIKEIISNKNYNSHFRDIWGLSVITSETDSIINILQSNQKLGLNRMQIKMARLKKENSFAITDKNIEYIKILYQELIDIIKKESFVHDYTILKTILNENDYLGKLLIRIILGEKTIRRCFAAVNKISFDVNGNIYPCDSFLGTDYCIGNIEKGLNDILRNKILNASIFNRKQCSECWARYICGGDCYHNSLLTNNNIYTPDPLYCELAKFLIKKSLDIVNTIKVNGDLQKLYSYLKLKKRLKDT